MKEFKPCGVKYSMTEYRDYYITYDAPPIPVRTSDWQFSHKDYDGAPEHSFGPPMDKRCGTAGSLQLAKDAIDDLYDMYPEDHE